MPRGFVWLAVLCGCGNGGSTEEEGDDAEECRDGADNDRDGDFDCDDSGCVGSPDCVGSDNGNGGPNDNNGGGGTTPNGQPGDDTMSDQCGDGAVVEGVLGTSITLTIEYDIVPGFEAFTPDCKATYEGAGSNPVVEGDCVTFEQGTWSLSSTDCVEDLVDDDTPAWYASNGQAYHTFLFTNGGDVLDTWTAHANRREGVPNDAFAEQFWVDTIASSVPAGGKARYEEEETLVDSGSGIQLGTITIDWVADVTRE